MRTPLSVVMLLVLAVLALPAAAAQLGATAGLDLSADAAAPAVAAPPAPAGSIEDALPAPLREAPLADAVQDALADVPLAPDVADLVDEATGGAVDAGPAPDDDAPLEPAGARVQGNGWDEPLDKGVLDDVPAAAPAAVAGAGLLALVQAMGGWRWLGAGAFALYSRLTKSDLLDNEHRDRVYKLVQETPGLGLTEIAEKSGLGWGTTVYHLDRLERAGFVASERAGLHRCYFPVGTLAKETRKGIGALKADTTRSIAEYLLARPGVTQSELCQALNMSASAASKQITKLEQAGLVRRERDWKTVHLYPQPQLPEILGGDAPAMPAAAAPAPAAVLA